MPIRSQPTVPFVRHSWVAPNLPAPLIEKQQQLIALLGEKRQAVISHAVTKGLNPDVRGWRPPSSEVELETEMELA